VGLVYTTARETVEVLYVHVPVSVCIIVCNTYVAIGPVPEFVRSGGFVE
jgi:hypothetical protein